MKIVFIMFLISKVHCISNCKKEQLVIDAKLVPYPNELHTNGAVGGPYPLILSIATGSPNSNIVASNEYK